MPWNLLSRTRPNGVAVPLLVWMFSVVVFASCYYLLWNMSPDAFIVNKEFNLRPLDTLRTLYFDDDAPLDGNPSASPADDLAGSNDRVGKLVDDVRQQRARLKKLTEQETIAKAAYLEAANKLDEERAKQVDTVSREQIKEAEASVAKRKAVVAEHDIAAQRAKQAGDVQQALHETEQVLEATTVAGQAEIALANKRADLAAYAVQHWGEFGTAATKEAFERTYREYQAVVRAETDVQNQRMNTRQAIAVLVQTLWADRRSRLGLVDFAYFSAGISTSNAFGDITANSRPARACVISQIVVSVMIVAWFLKRLFESKQA